MLHVPFARRQLHALTIRDPRPRALRIKHPIHQIKDKLASLRE
jgi:hypothetical protein